MQIFIEILKLTAMTLIPGAVALGIYVADKKIYKIKYLNKYIKGVIIGVIFTGTTMLNFYCGMNNADVFQFEHQIQGSFGPILASPMIAATIFGWIPGLTTGVAGFFWRFFVVDLNIKDYLRFPNSICILVAALIGIFINQILMKKNKTPTPKWTYGIVIGLIIESIHLLVAFPIITIKYDDIDFAHDVINKTDWLLFLTTTISISLSLLWLNIYNKQKIRVFTRETKLDASIQRRMTLTFALGLLITFGSSTIISLVKSYGDAESDLILAGEDVVNEINDTKEEFAFVSGAVLKNIVSNRRVRTNGFIIIAAAKDQKIMKPWNNSNDEEYVEVHKNQILGTPNRFSASITYDLYFDDDPNKTCEKYLCDTITFKDKDNNDVTCSTSKLVRCSTFDYNKKKSYNILLTILKMDVVGKDNSFYVASILTLDEATDSVVLSCRISLYFEILVYSIVYILVYRLIKSKVVDNIDSINSSLTRISDGKLNTKVNVRTYEEFSSLSDDINSTVDVLKGYIKEANKRIDDELQYAKTIQMNSIPLVFPISKYFDLHASMVTAKQVGGDFYDFFFIDDNHLFFMVADVSGKGVPAAMFMMRAKTLVNALAQTKELTLDQIMDNVNDELNVDNKSGMFVTAYAGILDVTTGKVEYVNAGHTRPLIKTKLGKVSYLQMKSNTVLGVIPGYKYALETTYLKPGDQILVYTDGVTEATNKKKQLYGEDRLMKLFNSNKFSDSVESISILNKELTKFQKGVEQADDITILSLIYRHKK